MIDGYIHKAKYFAYNVWSFESAKAVIDACQKGGRDALIQTSLKAFQNLPPKRFAEFVHNYSEERGINAYLNLDHSREIESINQAIECGWDSVMIDASDKLLDDNILMTNKVCEIAHKENVLVEAEVGQIIGNKGVADYDDVCRFIDNTEADMLAVAIGTKHGLYSGDINLDYELLRKVAKYKEIPLVVHGGTGISKDMFNELIRITNVKKINISTDVKLAYRRAIINCQDEKKLEKDGFNPISISEEIQNEIQKLVIKHNSLIEEIENEKNSGS